MSNTQGSGPTWPSGPTAALDSPELGTRYDLASVLGRGGMGEVRLGRDRRIGREVAVKLMRLELRDEAAMTRFFREAHVQGLLDHPSVVPIHDLGVDASGNPFFVMKRISGTTLAAVLGSDPAASTRWSRPQILARFVDVCLAVDYAHTRGVIHRDIKPANLMLGDFGETYLLDWGLARVNTSRHSMSDFDAPGGGDGETQAGEMLGTPGYMSPEQARGETVEPSTDVYALGCVLFEILAGQPALPRGLAAIPETLAADHHRPSDRATDVAPELDELCVRATAAEPARRLTARELADGVQAHLDGNRDLVRRRELAAEHARKATDAEAEAGADGQASAVREAGRALALDPSNPTAQLILGRLMLATPQTVPAQALATADAERGRTRQGVLRMAGFGYLWMIVAVVVLMMLPVHQLWLLGVTAVLALATGVVALAMSRWVMPMRSRWFIALLVLNCALIAMSGVLFTPLLIMPIFLIGSLTGWLQQPTGYSPWIVVVAHVVPFVALVGLEAVGVTPSTFHIDSGELVVTPWVVDLTPTVTFVVFAVAFAAQAVTSIGVMLQNRYSQEAAQNRQHTHAWHLRQLLPLAEQPS